MTTLFIGNSQYAAFAIEKACDELGSAFELYEPAGGEYDYSSITGEIVKRNAKNLIFDLSATHNKEGEITHSISKILSATNSRAFIYAPGYSEDSALITSLASLGIMDVIYEPENQRKIMDEFKLLFRYPKKISEEEHEEIVERKRNVIDQVEESNPGLRDVVTRPVAIGREGITRIAVVGCMNRIGTTTTALQLVKYINYIAGYNKTACYVEMESGFCDGLRSFYGAPEVEKNMICFNDVALWTDPMKVDDLQAKGYEFLVYDYGNINNADLASVLERDIVVVVTGASPQEADAFKEINKEVHKSQVVNYVMNFVAEEDWAYVLPLMEDKRDVTGFLRYTPDPFVLNSENEEMLKRILSTPPKQVADAAKKDKKFFKRLFGK